MLVLVIPALPYSMKSPKYSFLYAHILFLHSRYLSKVHDTSRGEQWMEVGQLTTDA